MFDQAETLRRMMRDEAQQKWKKSEDICPRVIAISGGKGGVGKTLATANLAVALAQDGKKTLLIDGDFGLANLDVVLGLRPKWTLDHVLSGEKRLPDILLEGPGGVKVLPAASGLLRVPELGPLEKVLLLDQVEQLEECWDALLIDTAAGLSPLVQNWIASAAEVLLVVTPEPASLADAYALMKVCHTQLRESRFKLLANMVRHEAEGTKVFEKISSVAEEYLGVRVEYVGSIPFDEAVRQSVRERVPFVQKYPFSDASRAMRAAMRMLWGDPPHQTAKGTAQFFWRRMVALGRA